MLPQLGMPEMIMVMVVAVLLFGKRLPEVGRSLGKGLVEFKKGLRGIEDEFDTSASVPSKRADDYHAKEVAEPNFPKFETPDVIPRASVGDGVSAHSRLIWGLIEKSLSRTWRRVN